MKQKKSVLAKLYFFSPKDFNLLVKFKSIVNSVKKKKTDIQSNTEPFLQIVSLTHFITSKIAMLSSLIQTTAADNNMPGFESGYVLSGNSFFKIASAEMSFSAWYKSHFDLEVDKLFSTVSKVEDIVFNFSKDKYFTFVFMNLLFCLVMFSPFIFQRVAEFLIKGSSFNQKISIATGFDLKPKKIVSLISKIASRSVSRGFVVGKGVIFLGFSFTIFRRNIFFVFKCHSTGTSIRLMTEKTYLFFLEKNQRT